MLYLQCMYPVDTLSNIFNTVTFYGSYSIRPLAWAFAIERTIATIKSDVYEKDQYFWHFMWIIVLMIILNVSRFLV